MSEKGPIYGTDLIKRLPIGGGMSQAMPSRGDLQQVAEVSQRTAAGYEVLLNHYQIQAQRIVELEQQLAKATQAVEAMEGLEKIAVDHRNYCALRVWFFQDRFYVRSRQGQTLSICSANTLPGAIQAARRGCGEGE